MARGSAPGTIFSLVAAAQCSQLLWFPWNELCKVLSFKISLKKFKSIDMFWRERTGCVYPVHRSSCVSFIFVVSYKNTSEQYAKPVTCVAINSGIFYWLCEHDPPQAALGAVAHIATCRDSLRGILTLFKKSIFHIHFKQFWRFRGDQRKNLC